jgi:hypothetical protein
MLMSADAEPAADRFAATLLGGSGDDQACAIALDAAGNVYLAGKTMSPDFPATARAGADNPTNRFQVFVAKFDPDLGKLRACLLLGGSDDDEATDLAVDPKSGEVLVLGNTLSGDFPTTAGAFRKEPRGGWDVFIARLDPKLKEVRACTRLGSAKHDRAYGLALDPAGNVYVAGGTGSRDYPVTAQAYSRTWQGGLSDIMVSKLDPGLGQLLASTYLGGTGELWQAEIAYDLALDRAGNVYVAGYADSSNYPVTPGAYQNRRINCNGLVVSKLDGNLSRLLASTLVGAYGETWATGIAVNDAGEVVVAGYTRAYNYPITPGGYPRSAANTDALLSKFDGDLAKLLASTMMGCSGATEPGPAGGLALDGAGNILTAGAGQFGGRAQPRFFYHGGAADAAVACMDKQLERLLYSYFIGGSARDEAGGLALGKGGTVYVVGNTASSNWPTTAESREANFRGKTDVFVARLGAGMPEPKREDLLAACDRTDPVKTRWSNTVLVANFDSLSSIDTSFAGGNNWDQGSSFRMHMDKVGHFSFRGGERDFMRIEDSPSLHPRAITVGCWIHAGKPVAGANWTKALVCKDNPGGARDWGLLLFSTNGQWRARWECSAQAAGAREPARVELDGASVPLLQWHQVLATYDGKTACLYLDGKLTHAREDGPGELRPSTNAVQIARRAADLATTYSGSLDHVRIYNVALSSNEVLNLFKAGR